MFLCDICGKIFQYKNNMYAHRKKIHDVVSFLQPKKNKIHLAVAKQYICHDCGFECRLKKDLIPHFRKNHYPEKSIRRVRLKCPFTNCDALLKKFENLDSHLSEEHAIKIEEEYFEFQSEGEFHVWKINIEKETQNQYFAERGRRQRKGYSQREYVCHRSYDANLKSHDRKRARKSLITNKIGAACPARMIVKYTDEKVMVNFIRVHVGHSAEVIRMRLPSDQRALIAGKLKDGVTIQRVLDDIRDSGVPENLERIHYIQKKDIRNILRDFNIGYAPRLHNDNVVSVEILVNTLRGLEDSPILHYNSDYKNFSLIIMTPLQKEMLTAHPMKICVDGTHSLNAYGHQLVTILVIDEYNNGVPVAFCFTKKTDFAAIALFYSAVKDRVGPIQTDVFMSDDAPQFHDAWANVMGAPKRKLLCWWHIDKNWEKNLNVKISDPVKRKYVQHTLHSLATILCDENEFEFRLSTFLNDLCADEDTQSFHDYFSSTYLSKKKSWAFCYRKHLGLNTNMHLETMHKRIKHFYLEGKNCPRLDKAINSLLELVRDTMYERIIKLAKNQPSEKVLKIRASHAKRTEISNEDIVCIEESKLWYVTSQEDRQHQYEVRRVSENCQDTNLCILRCSECDVCVHTFKCSCVDNVVYLNICKHIHAVAEKSKVPDDEEFRSGENNVEVQKMIDLSESHPQLDEERDNANFMDNLETKLRLLLQRCRDLSWDEQKLLSKRIDEIIYEL